MSTSISNWLCCLFFSHHTTPPFVRVGLFQVLCFHILVCDFSVDGAISIISTLLISSWNFTSLWYFFFIYSSMMKCFIINLYTWKCFIPNLYVEPFRPVQKCFSLSEYLHNSCLNYSPSSWVQMHSYRYNISFQCRGSSIVRSEGVISPVDHSCYVELF